MLTAGLTIINAGTNASPASGGLPNKAYLRAIFYHKENNAYIRQQTQNLASGANTQQNLSMHFEAETDGTLQIFVANEANTDVFFDNISITHEEHFIVQEKHYYPFGMNLVGIEKEGMPEDRFQYNGKEKQKEFGLNWMDYGARLYSFDAPKWWQIDPMAGLLGMSSPYVYALNNLIIYVDKDGELPILINENCQRIKRPPTWVWAVCKKNGQSELSPPALASLMKNQALNKQAFQHTCTFKLSQ